MQRITLTQEESFLYEGFGIFYNKWEEYCVMSNDSNSMVCFNSGFKTLEQAKVFVKKIYLRNYSKEQLEKIALQIKTEV